MALGWCRRDAEQLGVIEFALDSVMAMPPRARAVLARHASTVLSWQPIRCAVPELYGEQRHAPAWRALSAAAEPPYDHIMSAIAGACDGKRVVSGDAALGLLAEPDTLHHTAQAHRAEARGDLQAALDHLSLAIRPAADFWRIELEYVLARQHELSEAEWGQFLCGAALRWGLHTDLGITDGLRYAEAVLSELGFAPDEVHEQAPSCMGNAQLVHDALLFDSGMLDAWVDLELGPGLAAKVPGFGAWLLAQPTVCELAGPVEGGALMRDLRTGFDVVVAPARVADEHPPGRLVYGRLVRVDGDERSWFASRPTILDDARVARQLLEALEAGCPADERLRIPHRNLRAAA